MTIKTQKHEIHFLNSWKKAKRGFFFFPKAAKQTTAPKKTLSVRSASSIKVLNPLQNVLCFSISMQIMLFFLVEALPSFHSKCVKHLVQECFFSPCPQITLLAFKRLQRAVSKSLFCAFSSECHLPSEQDVNKSDVILFLKQSSPVTVFQHVSVKV